MTNSKGKIDRGAIVDKAIKRLGYSITKLARELGTSRTTLYRKFEEEDLPDYLIHKIGHYIRYDFSKEIPDLGPDDTLVLPLPPETPPKEEQEKKLYTIPEVPMPNFTEPPSLIPKTLQDCKSELIALQREHIALQKYTISLLQERLNHR